MTEKYIAAVFNYALLPQQIKDDLETYYAEAGKVILNNTYHPFPLTGKSVIDALDEVNEMEGDSYYKDLLIFFSGQKSSKGYVIIRFDW